MNHVGILFVLAGLPAMLCNSDAYAADYVAGITIRAEASRNDNIRLVEHDQTAVTKYAVSPTLTTGLHTETTTADLYTTLNLTRYDKSEFNSNDQSATVNVARQFEASALSLGANYNRNSTLNSELLTTGRIGNVADRAQQYSASPSWSYSFDESSLIQLSGTYLVQRYDRDSYIGYKNVATELDFIHLVSERTRFIVAATYSEYHSDGISLEVPAFIVPAFPVIYFPGAFGQQSYSTQTRTPGVQLGLDYQWSEQSLIKVRVGRAQNRTSYPIKDPSHICDNATFQALVAANGPIGGVCGIPDTKGQQSTLSLEWKWNNERQQINLNVSKAIQPTSNGYAVDNIQLRSDWSFQLFPRDRISAHLSAVRNRAMDQQNPLLNTAIADRNFGTATLDYQRRLTERWFLSALFQLSEQEYTRFDSRARSHVYTLQLTYQPQQWHWAK